MGCGNMDVLPPKHRLSDIQRCLEFLQQKKKRLLTIYTHDIFIFNQTIKYEHKFITNHSTYLVNCNWLAYIVYI